MAADKTLACRDCGSEFVFTAGEQDFFAQKGFSDPTRCPACRATRKMERLRMQSEQVYSGSGGRTGRGERGYDLDREERPRRGRW